MKHKKKPGLDPKRIGKIAAGKIAAGTVASIAVITGGVHLWNGYQNGNLFRPDLFVSNHDYQENQIMFPEKQDYGQTTKTDQSDENRRLERDPQADDSYGKDKQDEPEYKLSSETNIQTDIQNASNLLIDSSRMEDNSSGTLPQGFENSATIISNSSNGSGHTIIQVPSGDSGTSGNGSSLLPRRDDSDSDSDSDSGSGSHNSGGSTSGGGTSGGGGAGDNGGTTTPTDPTPTPEPTPTPTPTPTPEPTPVVDPDYPNAGDKPSLPDTPTDIVLPTFPAEGIPSGERADSATLSFLDASDTGETLYYGAVLTDWKLLCSVYAFVDVKNANGTTTRYRLTDYSDNFRIGEFPSVATDDFEVKFYFRPNAESEWTETTCKFSVKYAKIVVMGDDDGTIQSEQYVKKGESICLLKQTSKYFNANRESWGIEDQTWESLDYLFPGWSLTPDGEPLGNWFTPEEPGRYVIYPLERVPISEDFWVYRSQGWDPTHSPCYLEYLQALLSGPSDQDVLEVPEGIHELWTVTNIGTLILPNSVFDMNPENYSVHDAYQVKDDNPLFSCRDGLLFSKDYTRLLGIPEAYFEELTISQETTYVNLPYVNEFQKIIFSSATPPEIDLNRLQNTTLVVPRASYTDYFLAWYPYLLSNNLTLAADDNIVVDYTYINDGLYSNNGTILHRISADHAGLFMAEDTLEIVKSGATDDCVNVNQIFFSDKLKTLEKNSLSASCLKTLYMTSETPPEIDAETFGDLEDALARGLQVIVPDTALEAYQEAWTEVLGESALQLLKSAPFGTVETENGLKYMNTAHGSILLQAPPDTTSFDDIVEEAGDFVIWTEIGSHAFDNCTGLRTLEIPETVTHIDSAVFAGCTSLEMILFQAEELTVDEHAFSSDGSLRTIAFNSETLTLGDVDMTSYVSVYIRPDCDVNYDITYFNRWGASYTFVEGETGTFAYGLDISDTGSEQPVSYLIGGTTDVSGAIEPPDGYILTQISPAALSECHNELTLSDEVAKDLFYIGSYAFNNSGLSGTLTLGNMYKIDNYAFWGCQDLTEVTIEESPYYFDLGYYSFGESGLERITLPPNLSVIGVAPFSYCAALKEVVLTGEQPPNLVAFSKGSVYSFGWDDWATWMPPVVKTTLSGDADFDAYLEKWKFALVGYGSEEELRAEKEDPDAYLFDWIMATFEPPYDDDGNYLPEYLDYVRDVAAAYVAQAINDGITKFYWYMDEEVPDGLLQDVVFPDISDYTGNAGGDIWDIWNTPSTATDSNAAVIVVPSDSDAKKYKASDSDAQKDLTDGAETILNSVGFVTNDDESVPQEEK